ncbi:CD3337/EF1877 family mobilome membrane protein [Muricomes intestini]|uniref:CD3337/EF1877 family mobilome membrane protein n=1 Tax=Muricomes intestini TaxID=1796634 RepID=UPI002FDF984D
MHFKKLQIKRIWKIFIAILLITIISFLFLAFVGIVVHASGLVDDTVSSKNTYSKYPLGNYQLDFYVDNSWDWLPWNWTDGIGKQVMYGLYAITNFIWTISLYLSNATGYLVQEAYSLDFISKTSDAIGKNMQTLAGISPNGFQSSGFYVGFLLIFILIVGIYVAYVGLIKKETTKAVHAVINLVMVFILSASFIAYAPDYISKINDFSSDVSSASLSIGGKIVMPNSESKGKDSVDMIRDNLFSIQVQQPWLLLQYGNSDIDKIRQKRVEKLLSADPDKNNGKDRETVVKEEIEDKNNMNLTITKTITRLGMVFFLLIFNIGISIFVFLLTGIMIFSQILFIIYAMFLPMSFLLSMIPGFDNMAKRAIMKLFNVIMTRAGITLIVTTAFSISTILYTLSEGFPFFLIAFLQIVTFAGIYMKLGDLMGMFNLQANDSKQMEHRIFKKPYMLLNRGTRRLKRKIGRILVAGTTGAATGAMAGAAVSKKSGKYRKTQPSHKRPASSSDISLGERVGGKVGALVDTKDHIADKAGQIKEQAKDLPVNARYALYHGKKQVSDKVAKNVDGFKSGVAQTLKDKKQERAENRNLHRETIAKRRMEFDKARQQKTTEQPERQKTSTSAPIRTRPVTSNGISTIDRDNMNQANSSTNRTTTNSIEKPAMNRPVASTPRPMESPKPENHVPSRELSYEKRKESGLVSQKPTVKSATLKNNTQQRREIKEQVVSRQKGREK